MLPLSYRNELQETKQNQKNKDALDDVQYDAQPFRSLLRCMNPVLEFGYPLFQCTITLVLFAHGDAPSLTNFILNKLI